MKPSLSHGLFVLGMTLPMTFSGIGCDKDKGVSSYEAPKDTPPANVAENAGGQPSQAAAEVGFPGDLRWTLPAGWKQIPPPAGRMGIRATAAIQVQDNPPLIMTLSRLGEGGRDLGPNIARWAGIIKMTSPTPDQYGKFVTHKQNGDVPVEVIDLNNSAAQQRLLGIIVPHGSDTWDFKLSGPADQIGAQKSKFDEFVGSLHFDSNPAPAPAPQATQGPPAPLGETNNSAANGVSNVRWTLPAGWTAEAAGGMRLATIHPGNGAALIKVSKFGSVGGGLGINVSRWRGEVGLSPVDDAAADAGTKITVGGQPCTIHDYTGPANGGSRLIVAAIDANGETWYFKLSGPEKEVGPQKAAFDQFLASLKFGS